MFYIGHNIYIFIAFLPKVVFIYTMFYHVEIYFSMRTNRKIDFKITNLRIVHILRLKNLRITIFKFKIFRILNLRIVNFSHKSSGNNVD